MRGLAVANAFLALSCSHPAPKAAPRSNRVWSDADVLAYALAARELVWSSSSGVLGRHDGLTLVQTISRNDAVVGPSDLALVIHYELAKERDCAREPVTTLISGRCVLRCCAERRASRRYSRLR